MESYQESYTFLSHFPWALITQNSPRPPEAEAGENIKMLLVGEVNYHARDLNTWPFNKQQRPVLMWVFLGVEVVS